MSDPNEPRLMKPRRAEARVRDHASGKPARDGFTRIARKHRLDEPSNDPMAPFGLGARGIQPEVGERDWNRGPRFSED